MVYIILPIIIIIVFAVRRTELIIIIENFVKHLL